MTVDDPAPGFAACGRLLPPDARVLIVGEGRSFGMPRPHHASSPYDEQLVQGVVEEAADAQAVATALRAAGWTHLFISRLELARLGGADYRVLRWRSEAARERWGTFLRDSTGPVWSSGGLEVRRITGYDATRAPHR